MMFEIAGGILIAYVVIKYWRQLIGMSLLLLVVGFLLVLLGIAVWAGLIAHQGNETARAIFLVLGVVGVIALVVWAMDRHDSKQIAAKYRSRTSETRQRDAAD